MKKLIVIIGACAALLATLVIRAEVKTVMQPTTKPLPMNCDTFLKNELVQDQLNEVFGDNATYTVKYDQQKNICTLNVKSQTLGKTFQFSSLEPENFTRNGKTLTLYLFASQKPECTNALEADFEDNNIIDAGYYFPIVDNTCDQKQ